MNITIILTSTVNIQEKKGVLFQKSKEERINSYIKPVKKWLYNSNFHIILVENSGYTFPELEEDKDFYKDRFEIISFIESNCKEANYLENDDGKGASEMFAINYAFRKSKKIQNSLFIIKLTARYFIPDLENYLLMIDLGKYDGICQHDINRCEMVGSRIDNFPIIFNKYLIDDKGCYDQHVENIYKLRMSWFNNILRCNLFNIEPTQRGGIDKKFHTI
jgi:hypothetical protein